MGQRNAMPPRFTAKRAAVAAILGSLLFSTASAPAQDCFNWIEVSPILFPGRYQHALAFDSDRGAMVLFGGVQDDQTVLSDTWEWNGSWWTFIDDGVPSARTNSAMAYDAARGVVVLFGGRDAFGALLADTWIYNGLQWTQLAPDIAPTPRESHAMTYDSARQRVLLFGGYDGAPNGQTWEWDGQDWTLTSSTGPAPRHGHGMAYYQSLDRTVVFGGNSGNGMLGDTWDFDGATATWVQRFPQQSPSPRADMAMSYDASLDVAVLFGGIDAVKPYSETWEWDGVNWTRVADRLPFARWGTEAVYDSSFGVTLIYGGGTIPVSNDDIWQWDGYEWWPITGATPVGRSAHRMAFDTNRGVTVMQGGQVTEAVPDTWEWDGAGWQFRAGASGPPPRLAHAMAFDEARGVTLLFGGTDLGVMKNDTWIYDGDFWSEMAPQHVPPARSTMDMAYDAARQVVVLFGGFTEAGDRLADTWEWDGVDWTLRAVPGPSGRAGHGMSYDADRGVVVLFGGRDVTGRRNDTWEWDGTTWLQKMTSVSPSPRSPYWMLFDQAAHRTLLFGGLQADDVVLGDTWAWNGDVWQQIATDFGAARHSGAGVYDSYLGVAVVYGGSGESPWQSDVWEGASFPIPGDADCDGFADSYDVEAFITALLDRDVWQSIYACSYECANDLNGDGIVNGGDVRAFAQRLAGP